MNWYIAMSLFQIMESLSRTCLLVCGRLMSPNSLKPLRGLPFKFRTPGRSQSLPRPQRVHSERTALCPWQEGARAVPLAESLLARSGQAHKLTSSSANAPWHGQVLLDTLLQVLHLDRNPYYGGGLRGRQAQACASPNESTSRPLPECFGSRPRPGTFQRAQIAAVKRLSSPPRLEIRAFLPRVSTEPCRASKSDGRARLDSFPDVESCRVPTESFFSPYMPVACQGGPHTSAESRRKSTTHTIQGPSPCWTLWHAEVRGFSLG